jgi:hypothetical protein
VLPASPHPASAGSIPAAIAAAPSASLTGEMLRHASSGPGGAREDAIRRR